MGVRARLAPVGKLARSLVQLMLLVQRGLNGHIASTSSRLVSKDDCRRWKIKIHAGSSEAEPQ